MKPTEHSVSPVFPEAAPWSQLAILLLFLLVGTLVGTLIMLGLGEWQGIDVQQALQQIGEDSPASAKNFIRLSTLINHLTTFVLPALLFAWFFYRKQWFRFLRLDRQTAIANVLLGLFFIMATFPLAQWSFQLNKAMPLPEWANTMEDSAAGLVTGLLSMNSVGELLFNLLIIALIPALGEELLFRGVIQQKLAEWTRRPELAVWLAAMLFSAMHLQFQGFLPRLLLGAALGYLLLWTKNIWIPILAHFLNNGLQIVVAYFAEDQLKDLQAEGTSPEIPLATAIFSAIFVLAIGYTIRRYNAERT